MAKRRTFRPSVSRLEDRIALSGDPSPPLPPPNLGGDSPSEVSVTPTAGNEVVAFPWMATHEAYVSSAEHVKSDVVLLGDSITFFWGDRTRFSLGSAAWSTLVGSLRVANFGIPGDQTQNVLWRIQNGELEGHPKLVVLMVGVNNIGHDQTPSETADGIAADVAAIRTEAPNTTILLLGILPVSEGYFGISNAPIRQVNGLIAGLDDGEHVHFLDVAAKFLERDGNAYPGFFLDGIHPSITGYEVLAGAIQGTVQALAREASPASISVNPTRPPTDLMPTAPTPSFPAIPVAPVVAAPSSGSPQSPGGGNPPSPSGGLVPLPVVSNPSARHARPSPRPRGGRLLARSPAHRKLALHKAH